MNILSSSLKFKNPNALTDDELLSIWESDYFFVDELLEQNSSDVEENDVLEEYKKVDDVLEATEVSTSIPEVQFDMSRWK